MLSSATPRLLVRRTRHPYAAVWAAVALWSMCGLLVRAAHTDAVRFTTWRLWFALPPLFLLVTLRARRVRGVVRFALPGRSRLVFVAAMAAGGLLFAGGAATAFAAINSTTLLDATLIPALQPVVVIVFAVLVLQEVVGRDLVVRCSIAVAGTALVAVAASGRGTWSLAGDLMAVVSLFVNAGWHLYGRWIRHRFEIDPIVFMTCTLTCAAVFLTPFAFVTTGGLHVSGHALGYAAGVMVIGTTAHITMVWAHRWVPASESAPVLLAEPACIALGGWVVFGDAPGGFEIVGSVIVLVALVGVVRYTVVTNEIDDEALEPTV